MALFLVATDLLAWAWKSTRNALEVVFWMLELMMSAWNVNQNGDKLEMSF